MIECSVGDVVSVEFPYSDLQGHKRRPGLVLAVDSLDILLARLTTRPARDSLDIALTRWTQLGLPKPSTVRLTKLAAIDRRLVHHKIGRLHPEDSVAVARAWLRWTTGVGAALQA